MIATDKEALICDLAETYGIFDYKSIPCKTVAILASGLRENSRIRMRLEDSKVTTEELLLSSISDNLSMLVWMNSKDGAKGRDRPKMILQNIYNDKKEDEVISFSTAEEFLKARYGDERRGEECQGLN